MTPKPSPSCATDVARAETDVNPASAGPHRSLLDAAAQVAKEEKGQSMAEWAILVAFLVAGLAAVFGVFPYVIASYYREIVEVIALPLP